MTIDFVIPWVDGSDLNWRKERAYYSGTSVDLEECRFRDWDLLQYWFRAVEAYAPWVHKIYFVTWNQIPHWLNINHPKLQLIDHRDYIPEAYLPTFSSHTIELNFHRISSLSEHFVYFNDDMFLNAPVEPEDFFRNGVPCDCAVMGDFCAPRPGDIYVHAQCNVMGFLNTHFHKREVLRAYAPKWFDPRNGKAFLKNIYASATRNFSLICNQHLPSSMLKSTYRILWDLEPGLLDATCRNKFRSLGDVNQYIISYYNLCTGNFHPRPVDFGKCYSIGRNADEMLQDILHGRHKTICLNDNPFVMDFELEKRRLLTIYQRKLPDKSSFEL